MRKKKKEKIFLSWPFWGRRDGKGVKKGEFTGPPTFKNFFKTFFRRFNKLLSLNLIMWFKIPMYLLVFGLASYLLYELGSIFEMFFATSASLLGEPVKIATSPLFTTVNGAHIASSGIVDGNLIPSPGVASLLAAMYSNIIEMPTYSIAFFVVIAVLSVFVLATWGWQNVGSAYVTRGMLRGDPIFVFSDFFHGIKKNWKQGLFLGVIDALIIILLTFNFCYLYMSSTSLFTEILLVANAGILIIYTVMRKYIYQLAITFDITIGKIFKNAFIFTVLGIKRNAVGSLGSLVLLALNVLIGVLCMNFNFIIPLMLPLVYYMGVSSYISTYSAYPVIDKYMIEPYKKAHPEEFFSEEDVIVSEEEALNS